MDISKMLADLYQIEQAIVMLERIALGQGKRRGHPPLWMTAAKPRGRPPGIFHTIRYAALERHLGTTRLKAITARPSRISVTEGQQKLFSTSINKGCARS